MQELNIVINGYNYTLACGEGENNHVSQLAEEINMRAKQVAGSMPQARESMTLVMTALMLADELYESRQESGALHEQVEKMRNEINELKKTKTTNQAPESTLESTIAEDYIPAAEAQASLSFMMDEVAQHIENIAFAVENTREEKGLA